MTQEEQSLLLKDLCARLPFGIKIKRPVYGSPDYVSAIDIDAGTLTCLYNGYTDKIEKFIPYLRSLSSMTKEEKNEYELFYCYGEHDWDNYTGEEEIPNIVDWLNEHHFDFRGLIEKGLAIEVTKENNPYKE